MLKSELQFCDSAFTPMRSCFSSPKSTQESPATYNANGNAKMQEKLPHFQFDFLCICARI